MATTIIKSVFQFRRATASEWESVNPILRLGEPGYDTDSKKHKIGDGVTAWNSLPFQEGEEYVVNRATCSDFPKVGKDNVIYKAEKEKKVYQWNSESQAYEPIEIESTVVIESIDGGSASGMR